VQTVHNNSKCDLMVKYISGNMMKQNGAHGFIPSRLIGRTTCVYQPIAPASVLNGLAGCSASRQTNTWTNDISSLLLQLRSANDDNEIHQAHNVSMKAKCEFLICSHATLDAIMPVDRCCVSLNVCGVRMGEVACCDEIKAFMARHNVKQLQVASLTGKCRTFRSVSPLFNLWCLR